MALISLHNILGRALSHDYAAAISAFRSHIDDPVGCFHHFKIMLDHNHRIALIDKLVEHFKELGHIVEMEPGGGLIQEDQLRIVDHGHGKGQHRFTEADWTDITSPDAYAYVKSKTIAERAARDWVAANALAVPLTSLLIMPSALLASLLMPFGLEALPLRVMALGVEAVLAIARAVAAWPGASLSAPPLPGWGLGLCALGMVWLALWRGPARAAGAALLVIGLASGSASPPPDALISADARLIALRNGQGEVFLQRASGATRFTRDAWLRGWGEEEGAAMPEQGGAAGGGCVVG